LSPSRKIPLLIGCLLLLALCGIVILDDGAAAAELDPLGVSDTITTPNRPEKPDVDPLVVEGQGEPDPPDRIKPVPVPGSDMGLISGRIAVSTRVVDRLSGYQIIVQEDINPNALEEGAVIFTRKKGFNANLSRGTPFFDIDKIPFSSHPYLVTVVAPGMNGSSDRVYVTAKKPHGSKEVQLALTPGAIYSVMLRDQRRVPRRDLNVRLVPVGASLVRRDIRFGTTNEHGNVIFENVLRGDYDIVVGPINAPMAPPERKTVYAATAIFAPKPQPQGTTVIVPDGHDVTVEVASRWGSYVAKAELKAWQLDVKRYFEFKGTTDDAGRVVFRNMPYGRYQISATTPHNGRRDVRFEVAKDAAPPRVLVKMPR